MEHRWGARYLLDLAVRLDGRPRLSTWARLRNASVSGAYIETSAAPTLWSRVHVELDCRFEREERARIPAYVVRRGSTGIGVEWCDLAPKLILALIGGEALLSLPVLPSHVPVSEHLEPYSLANRTNEINRSCDAR